jgi:hypothetical protein
MSVPEKRLKNYDELSFTKDLKNSEMMEIMEKHGKEGSCPHPK